ncbi:glyoxalase [Rathayibacter iranicus]|uniref:Glyoxalase n=3 Tax=Rathayibacter iranicus TaxID=59737 RepID=A0AAD1AI33_9MICO|nr:VOC family protein [Rathayibacter iranicus]AZZ57144.1 glyoxalase [Rathayibacter iranicus]MWV29776.1 glyoxalase [Rathayibacter iranicus NCPPB 2253 = VKM Ac-1602]PPI41386.1 glyoxalase [Rathayibacter iranicus]PPI57414.1 glyoxalase [Rathayibacter iranicus]PPI68281.1 glyoxalase [Rathayibacter iranicus]
MRLELVPLPVTDVDRSVAFYTEVVGFHLDHDVRPSATMRVVQLTPPGSACSIVVGAGMGPGPEEGVVRSLHLVIDDIAAARAELAARSLEVSEIQNLGGVQYAYFADPDGNTWALQQIVATAAPARTASA